MKASGLKLVSTVPLDKSQRARLDEISSGIEIVSKWASAPDEVAGMLDAETAIVYSFRVPTNTLSIAPGLQWIQLLSAGCEHLEGNPVMASAVKISTVSGVHATPIAEYVMGTMLALYRWLPQAFRAQARHDWIAQDDFARGSRELRGRTVGIIGYGSIGREIARLVKPFGTTVLALKRNPGSPEERGYCVEGTGDPEGKIPDKIFGPDKLHDLLAQSDVVVIALPSTGATRALIDAHALAAMKPQSYLINIARGDIVVESDLLAALNNGALAGAALDVFENEPLPASSPLWDMENVIVTPHVSGASRPYLRRCFEVLATNLERFVSGRQLLNLVDPESGY